MTMNCQRIIQAAINSIPEGSPIAQTIRFRIEDITWAPGYAEPGYSDPEAGVFFGDWNNISTYHRETYRREESLPGHNIVKRLGDLLEKAGAEIEWCDEWTTCCDCGKAIRTSADSYCWTPHFVWANECEIVCLDCADESVLDQYINEPTKCLPPGLKNLMQRAGFEQINREKFESGWHPGQNDDPKKIFAEESKHCDELIFVQDEQSQFYIRFSVWGRHSEELRQWEAETRAYLARLDYAQLTNEASNGTSDWQSAFHGQKEAPTREQLIELIIETERPLKH